MKYSALRDGVQWFLGWLSIEDRRMHLTLLDLQPIFTCFGNLSSSIMTVSGKVKVSHST